MSWYRLMKTWTHLQTNVWGENNAYHGQHSMHAGRQRTIETAKQQANFYYRTGIPHAATIRKKINVRSIGLSFGMLYNGITLPRRLKDVRDAQGRLRFAESPTCGVTQTSFNTHNQAPCQLCFSCFFCLSGQLRFVNGGVGCHSLLFPSLFAACLVLH